MEFMEFMVKVEVHGVHGKPVCRCPKLRFAPSVPKRPQNNSGTTAKPPWSGTRGTPTKMFTMNSMNSMNSDFYHELHELRLLPWTK